MIIISSTMLDLIHSRRQQLLSVSALKVSSFMVKPQIRLLRGGSDLARAALVELNPDYENYGSDAATEEMENYDAYDSDYSHHDSGSEEDESDHDYDSESEDGHDDDDDDETFQWNKALAKSKKKAFASLQVAEQNRTILTLLCAIFAFRREIANVLLIIFTYPTQNGKRRLKFRISPTSILKIALFVDVMRKMMHSSSSSSGEELQPSPALEGNANVITKLWGELTHPSFTAYLPPVEQHYTFEKVHERYSKDDKAFVRAMNDPSLSRKTAIGSSRLSSTTISSGSALGMMRRTTSSLESSEKQFMYNGTCIILDLSKMDVGVSLQSVLRDQVSFIIHQHRSNLKQVETAKNLTQQQNSTDLIIPGSLMQNADSAVIPNDELEIIILLESPGGSASDYGLAASHIKRLRVEPGIKVTICVDKVAASGGYMIACMATPGQLYCAPFAVVGSIGVIGQTLNVHNTLQNWGVKPLVFRGGKDKAPIGLVGEITKVR